jgi:hypothetical protein
MEEDDDIDEEFLGSQHSDSDVDIDVRVVLLSAIFAGSLILQ